MTPNTRIPTAQSMLLRLLIRMSTSTPLPSAPVQTKVLKVKSIVHSEEHKTKEHFGIGDNTH